MINLEGNRLFFVSKSVVKPFSNIENITSAEIDNGLAKIILRNVFQDGEHCKPRFKEESIGVGFYSKVTGGKFRKLSIKNRTGSGNWPSSVFLKHSPSFSNEQKNLFELLDSLDHHELVEILKKYPSNQVNQRELMFYKYLAGRVYIKVPNFYFGVINADTEESWLFLEDLSDWQKIKSGDRQWTNSRLEMVLTKMAKFHSVFWNKDLKQFNWIGKWWNGRDNDYMAEDIVAYGLETCRKIFPNVLTSDIYKSLLEVNRTRSFIQKEFLEQKQTLIHWDFNPNNILFNKLNTKDEDFALLDWQITSIGIPHQDVAQLIISNMGIENKGTVTDLIKHYVRSLEEYTREPIDLRAFTRLFDLAVLDHFFRVCAPVLINGRNLDNDEYGTFKEWSNCLGWIRERSLSWL